MIIVLVRYIDLYMFMMVSKVALQSLRQRNTSSSISIVLCSSLVKTLNLIINCTKNVTNGCEYYAVKRVAYVNK